MYSSNSEYVLKLHKLTFQVIALARSHRRIGAARRLQRRKRIGWRRRIGQLALQLRCGRHRLRFPIELVLVVQVVLVEVGIDWLVWFRRVVKAILQHFAWYCENGQIDRTDGGCLDETVPISAVLECVLTACVDDLQVDARVGSTRISERRNVCRNAATALAVAHVHNGFGGVRDQARCE